MTCSYETKRIAEDRDRLITRRSRVRVLPAYILRRRRHAFVGGLARTCGCGVFAPHLAAGAAALLLAYEQIRDDIGQQMAFSALGFGVHGVRPVIIGQDHPEVVCGRVIGTARTSVCGS